MQYNKAPLPYKPVPALAVSGKPQYILGSLDDKSSPTQGTVISDASNGTTTATLIFQILSGNAPASGDLITVISTANGGGNFNVTNVALTSASTNILTGVCTVAFAITSTATPTSQTPDGGQVVIPRSEIGETPVVGASVPIAVAAINSLIDQGRVVACDVTFPIPGTMTGTFTLQGAMIDNDADYETVPTTPANVQITAGTIGTGYVGPMLSNHDVTNYRFYRIAEATITAGGGTVAGKILI